MMPLIKRCSACSRLEAAGISATAQWRDGDQVEAKHCSKCCRRGYRLAGDGGLWPQPHPINGYRQYNDGHGSGLQSTRLDDPLNATMA